jgi:hypothetical protein
LGGVHPQANPGILDKITARDEFLHAPRASAKLELAEWVRANGAQGHRKAAIEIVERHQRRAADFDAARMDIAAKILRYSTIGETIEAAERGRLSTQDLAMHLYYFQERDRQQRTQPKPKPARK